MHKITVILSCSEYLCPDLVSCASDANAFLTCPGLKGTHFDPTLSLDQRIDYLMSQMTFDERVGQLTSSVPSIPRLGITAYVSSNDIYWLNDGAELVLGRSARPHHEPGHVVP